MSIGEAVSSLGKSITSPAKLGFAAYVLLAYTGKIATSKCAFFVVAGIFFFLQVFHYDYLRQVLNRWADHGVFKFPPQNRGT
jgi:hypothetical protein